MKRTLLYIATACIAIWGCSRRDAGHTDAADVATDTLPTLIMQIQKCSRLYTAEYDIHKIVTYDDIVRLKGNVLNHDFNIRLPLGDRKIAIPIDVKLKAYIDFENFSEHNVVRHGDKITIILPDPKVAVTSSKVDHANTKEYVSLTRSHFTDAEMALFEQQGRAAVIGGIPRMGIIETARENAAHVLIPMIELMGFSESNITITFRKDFNDSDISNLLEKTTSGK